MTPVNLLDELRTRGVLLTVKGDALSLDAPKGTLTDALRQAIRTHKSELLRLLSQTTPAYESPRAEAQAIGQSTMSNSLSTCVDDLETPAIAWRCPCCKGTRRWRSIYEVLICARCHPPGDAALVAPWEGEDIGEARRDQQHQTENGHQ